MKNLNTLMAVPDFEILTTLTLGTFPDKEELKAAIDRSGCKQGQMLHWLIDRPAFTLASTPTEVDLVNVSVRDLGFRHGADPKHIVAELPSLGLAVCPPEVGPQLRLQRIRQRYCEQLRVFAEFVEGSDVNSRQRSRKCQLLYDVSNRDKGPELSWFLSRSGGSWNPDISFVFVKPRE